MCCRRQSIKESVFFRGGRAGGGLDNDDDDEDDDDDDEDDDDDDEDDDEDDETCVLAAGLPSSAFLLPVDATNDDLEVPAVAASSLVRGSVCIGDDDTLPASLEALFPP